MVLTVALRAGSFIINNNNNYMNSNYETETRKEFEIKKLKFWRNKKKSE